MKISAKEAKATRRKMGNEREVRAGGGEEGGGGAARGKWEFRGSAPDAEAIFTVFFLNMHF